MQGGVLGALLALLSLLGGCDGCSSDSKQKAADGVSSAAAASASSSVQADATLWLDGKRLRGLHRDALQKPTKLADLLPQKAKDPNSWALLKAVSQDGKRKLELRAVGERFTHLTGTVYATRTRIHFAMRRADETTDMSLPDVARIDVFTSLPKDAAAPTRQLIVPGRPATTLRVELLADLKTVALPGGRRTWLLSDAIAKLAGKARYTEVELVGVSKRVTLNQEQFKSTKETLRLKLNSAGKLRYRHYRIANGEAVKVNELDDVQTIILK